MKKTIPGNMIIKLLKTSDKEKNLKNSWRRKMTCNIQRNKDKDKRFLVGLSCGGSVD